MLHMQGMPNKYGHWWATKCQKGSASESIRKTSELLCSMLRHYFSLTHQMDHCWPTLDIMVFFPIIVSFFVEFVNDFVSLSIILNMSKWIYFDIIAIKSIFSCILYLLVPVFVFAAFSIHITLVCWCLRHTTEWIYISDHRVRYFLN